MRSIAISVVFCLAACGSTTSTNGKSAGAAPGEPLEKAQLVFRQYYGNSHIFIMENLAGRDMVALRSRIVPVGTPPTAYIEDDVMRELLREFRKSGFYDHAGPRPPNPLKVGGRGEVTLTTGGETISIIRRPGQTKDAFDAYDYCRKTLLAVYDFYAQYQSTTTTGDNFGVRPTDYDRR